jgi:hypothetical protein
VEVEAARMYGFWKTKRRGDKKEKNGFRIIIAETRGMCYHHNLAGPEGGPRARWAQRIIEVGLRIGPCAGVLRSGSAMYLDRCVCLN